MTWLRHYTAKNKERKKDIPPPFANTAVNHSSEQIF